MKRIHSLRICLVIAACFWVVGVAVGHAERTSETRGAVAIVVHGGAGTIVKANIGAERERGYRDKLTEALRAGYAILNNGGRSVDAVEAAIRILEDSELFNAGRGAVFTAQGKNELDASIMDGETGLAGSVGSVTTIKNPIRAARAVMEHTQHVMLVGRGAELFAAEQALDIVEPGYFFTQRRWDALLKAREKENRQSSLDSSERIGAMFGTVGCVALDRDGNLAAGTSTGGLTNKMHGRVGDSPIIGAGTYAHNSTCGVSATGQGEFFMRNLIAYDVAARMVYSNMKLDAAVAAVIDETLTGRGGEGGIIALDKDGHVAMRFNTISMLRGYMTAEGEPHVSIYGDE